MKKRMKRILSFTLFSVILLNVFLAATYLFRSYHNYDQIHIRGIKNEKKDSIDMVYIGGSAAFVYWQPLKAWNDCGLSSYLMATNTLQAEMIQYYIEEVQIYQNPQLYVIDVRPFQYWGPDADEAGIRNGSDSMGEFSFIRWKMLNAYIGNRNFPENSHRLSFYFDIAKYHTNQDALPSPKNWKAIYSQEPALNKGFEWIDNYANLDHPVGFETDNCVELPYGAIQTLEKLLTYCKSKQLQVLFVVCPYCITKDHQERYNFLQKVIEENGFQFLNTNLYLEEMGLDFSTDFYHIAHVNCFGAEKYTAFLEKYIEANYTLPDHRGEAAYDSWDLDFERFSQEELHHKEVIRSLQATAASAS